MNYYNEIKEEFINNEINRKVKNYSINKSDLITYYNVGKLLIEAQGGEKRAKYGDNLIKEYSKRLTSELGKGYSIRSLKDMRRFYLFINKGHAMHAQLSWNHYKKLFVLDNNYEIDFYIQETINKNISYRELGNKIKNKEYERLPERTKQKLQDKKEESVEDFIKNPIIINNPNNYEVISERVLQKLIFEDITSFMKELGNGFSFIDNEYKIKIGNRYYYIDLLLYNIIFNCYVVIELKITELKHNYLGQIELYMNYIDNNLKRIDQNKTIGIIICRKNNKFIMEYCSDDRVFSKEYKLV